MHIYFITFFQKTSCARFFHSVSALKVFNFQRSTEYKLGFVVLPRRFCSPVSFSLQNLPTPITLNAKLGCCFCNYNKPVSLLLKSQQIFFLVPRKNYNWRFILLHLPTDRNITLSPFSF